VGARPAADAPVAHITGLRILRWRLVVNCCRVVIIDWLPDILPSCNASDINSEKLAMSMREAVEGYYADWSRGDIDAVLSRCTDDVVALMGPGYHFNGKDQVMNFLQKFRCGMSNIHYDIQNVMEQDNIVMLEGKRNTPKNIWMCAFPSCDFFFEDGKIRDWRDYFDLDTVTKQLA
jgi:limonene-1,2-epoxide hydrolase